MIKRTEERLGLKPERLAADTAYGTGKFLNWVIGAGITPHIPVWDMSKREEGILSRADFTFDAERNLYICPQGKLLRTTGTVHVIFDREEPKPRLLPPFRLGLESGRKSKAFGCDDYRMCLA